MTKKTVSSSVTKKGFDMKKTILIGLSYTFVVTVILASLASVSRNNSILGYAVGESSMSSSTISSAPIQSSMPASTASSTASVTSTMSSMASQMSSNPVASTSSAVSSVMSSQTSSMMSSPMSSSVMSMMSSSASNSSTSSSSMNSEGSNSSVSSTSSSNSSMQNSSSSSESSSSSSSLKTKQENGQNILDIQTGANSGSQGSTEGNTLSFSGIKVGNGEALANYPVNVNITTPQNVVVIISTTTDSAGDVSVFLPKTAQTANAFNIFGSIQAEAANSNYTFVQGNASNLTAPGNYSAFMTLNYGGVTYNSPTVGFSSTGNNLANTIRSGGIAITTFVGIGIAVTFGYFGYSTLVKQNNQ